ncbi:MAG: D-alanyl-D-alanine carboxypeptidase family protein [Acidimicrobiales bacterium]
MALIVVVTCLVPATAGASRTSDDRNELVQRQRALVQELDELAASDEELSQALGILDGYMALQSEALAVAQAELAEATLAAERAKAAEVAKAVEVADLEDQMRVMAISAYVQPPGADHLETMMRADAPADAARLTVYLDAQSRRDGDLVRRLRQARDQLAILRARSESTEAAALRGRDDAATKLADLSSARDRYAEIHAEVQYRQHEAGLEVMAVRSDLERSNTSLVAEATRLRTAGVPLVWVRGIRVHRDIAGQVEMMIAAAEEDGIRLGGGGFRTNDAQIELRRRHCGDDHYAIYEMPASQCSPPTATPGNSLHELGLAIDFTENGMTISSRNSPAFRWLSDNAATYGFYNLPSEPWHWSINGS